MSEAFTVQLELLAELVERMAAFGTHAVAAEDEIDSRITRLHATWQGEAASLQAEAHRRWRAGAEQMRAALTTLRSIASTADQNYTSAMRANQQMWAV